MPACDLTHPPGLIRIIPDSMNGTLYPLYLTQLYLEFDR
jgi:hypothetical protein